MKPITLKRAQAVRKYVLSLCKGHIEFAVWVARLRYGDHCVDSAIGVVHGTIEGIPAVEFAATVGQPKVTVARYHYFNETLDVQLLGAFGSAFCAFSMPLPEELP